MIGGHALRLRLCSALGALSLVLLGGCAAAPDWHSISQQATEIRINCAAQQPERALAAEECANVRIHNLYDSAGFHLPLRD